MRDHPKWYNNICSGHTWVLTCLQYPGWPGSAFIKPDQRNPWIKDQIKITLLPTISHLLLPNFVSCGRACPSHMTQNLVTVGAKLWTADRFIVDPWSMDYADPVDKSGASVPKTFSYDGQLKCCSHATTILPLLPTATSFYMSFYVSQQSCRIQYIWSPQRQIGFDLDIRSSHASVWAYKPSQQQWVSCDARKPISNQGF